MSILGERSLRTHTEGVYLVSSTLQGRLIFTSEVHVYNLQGPK